jgi:hypothetical protein
MSDGSARQLADAVVEGIELARQPNSADRCRAWVEPWGLVKVGARLEGMLEEMASSGRRGVAAGPVEVSA